MKEAYRGMHDCAGTPFTVDGNATLLLLEHVYLMQLVGDLQKE